MGVGFRRNRVHEKDALQRVFEAAEQTNNKNAMGGRETWLLILTDMFLKINSPDLANNL